MFPRVDRNIFIQSVAAALDSGRSVCNVWPRPVPMGLLDDKLSGERHGGIIGEGVRGQDHEIPIFSFVCTQ